MFTQVLPACGCWSCYRFSPVSPIRYLVTGIAQLAFPRRPTAVCHRRWQRRGLDPDRPAVRRSEVLLGPAVRDVAHALQRDGVVRFEPGSAQSGARRRGEGPRQGAARCGSRQHGAGTRRSGDRLRQRARPGHQRRRRGVPGASRRQGARPARRPRSARSSPQHSGRGARLSSASRGSTCSSSTCALDRAAR